ncbi:hypothetical protein ACO0QE_000518 [Hanseniaspora vineae]
MLSRGYYRAAQLNVQLLNSTAKRAFGSTSVPLVSAKALKFLKSQRIRQKNEAKQASLEDSLDIVDPVLGRTDTPFITRVLAELKEPGVLVNQYSKQEVEKLIGLAELTKQEEKAQSLGGDLPESSVDSSVYLEKLENRKEAMLRILNLKNASSNDRLKLAIEMARKEFQRKEGDTGSSEVQAAVATVRIHMMAKHCKEHKKDHANLRQLRILVQQRQAMLKYLKREDSERYYWTITKLGLTDPSISREFNLDRLYMQEYNFFGDGKQLVKESKQVASNRRKEERKKKKSQHSASFGNTAHGEQQEISI